MLHFGDIEVLDVETYDMPKMRCPRCDAQSGFDIDTTFTIRMSTVDSKESWEPSECWMGVNDHTTCLNCGASGKLDKFLVE